MHVYIYNDEGASPFCVAEAEHTFEQLNLSVSLVDSNQLDLIKRPTKGIFVMPGGQDTPYLSKLGHRGCAALDAYVRAGGVYIGFCAGAYFGASRVEFELNTPLEVKGERYLKFYPGVAYGTLYPDVKFEYGGEGGAYGSLVKSSLGPSFYSYYNGGCSFRPDSNGCQPEGQKTPRIISSYGDVDQSPPAVLSINHGRGHVILSGVHPEISPEGAKENGTPLNVVNLVESTNNLRIGFMKNLIGLFT